MLSEREVGLSLLGFLSQEIDEVDGGSHYAVRRMVGAVFIDLINNFVEVSALDKVLFIQPDHLCGVRTTDVAR
jgi:hypothetical protein